MSESTNGTSNKSAFFDVQEAMGATFMEEGGWFWTMTFGDQDREYDAIRGGVGVWDVSPLNKWDFRGPDALQAAQRLNTNDIEALQVGQVRYGAFTDDAGLMTDDGTIFKLADDHCWVMTNSSEHAEEFAEATKGLNVGIDYVIEQMPHLQVQGPKSRETLQPVTDTDLAAIRYYWFVPERVKVSGIPVLAQPHRVLRRARLRAVRRSGERAGSVAGDGRSGLRPVRDRRRRGGAHRGRHGGHRLRLRAARRHPVRPVVRPAGEARSRLPRPRRAEGRGREPAQPAQGAASGGDEVPEYGAEVTKDGEAVGTLAGPANSPQFGVIGIAILDAAAAGEGERVDVALGDGTVPATVDANAAIYRPEKRRPRA